MESETVRLGVRVWIRKQISALLMTALLLFLAAGTLKWPLAWLQLVLYTVSVLFQGLLLGRINPALLAERSALQKGTKKWDIFMLSVGVGLLPLVAWLVAGLDFRFGWSTPMPGWQIALGVFFWVLGYALIIWAMTVNAFFSTSVRIQEERGHHVIDRGPYGVVRHPGYVGAIIFQLATPFLLSSWWALIPSVLSALIYVIRTALEDRTLQNELPGYREFTKRTRYRLLPGIW